MKILKYVQLKLKVMLLKRKLKRKARTRSRRLNKFIFYKRNNS